MFESKTEKKTFSLPSIILFTRVKEEEEEKA